MKKEYKKPELLFDSFELSVSIATGCVGTPVGPTENTCGIDFGGAGVLFLNGMTVCTTKIEDGDEGYCYHAPSPGNSLFNS